MILSAEMARINTNLYHSKFLKSKAMKKVFKEIQNATKQGLKGCLISIDAAVSKQVIETLVGLGYTVSERSTAFGWFDFWIKVEW